MTLKRNLSSVMGNAFVNTFKFMTNVAMVMLFATLTSCTQESLEIDPTAAKAMMVDSLSQKGLGWHLFTVKASATDINGKAISAQAQVRYETDPVVYVTSEEELGLPVTATTPDGTNFTTNNGNVIVRTESHSANGVNLNVAGGEWKNGTLGERIDEETQIRQICYAHISDQAFASADLPEKFVKEWRGEKVSVIEYHRVYVKPVTPVEPIVYRKSLTLDLEDAANGEAYGDMKVEKVQGTTVLDSWDCFGIMAKWGKYNPQVSSQSVNSFDFTSHDKAGEKKDLESDLPGLGKNKTFTRKNVRHTAETFEVRFQSNPDANGETIRPIRGQIDLWVYEYVFVNPEDEHTETFTVEVEVKSVKSEVNNSTYEREIHVVINGQTVDIQNGRVELTIG